MRNSPWVALVWLLTAVGCGGSQVPTETMTRYQPGDYVVYRYSGSYSEQPVTLEERIDRAEGNRLWIHVTAYRGDEQREWIQVVTDTPENQERNAIDELYEVRGGHHVRLSNEDNRDLLRLYSWTLPPCEGDLDIHATETRSMTIVGARFECNCVAATQMCSNRPAQMEACDCPQFLWTHASANIHVAEASIALWDVEVIEHGRR